MDYKMYFRLCDHYDRALEAFHRLETEYINRLLAQSDDDALAKLRKEIAAARNSIIAADHYITIR